MAIMAIVALGVGFFSGLKVSKEAMLSTGDDYLKGVNFFDFQGASTLGFDEEALDEIKSKSFVTEAEGSITCDILFDFGDDKSLVFKTMSIPEKLNLPVLTEGRMPEKPNECLLDDMWLGMGNQIGQTIKVSTENDFLC